MAHKTCIVVVGPTAVGKTRLSLALAGCFNTDIISADSRQCYTELNIGVAKPDIRDLTRIKHYFINSHSVREEVNAAVFEQYALAAAEQIFVEKDYAIVVGGTGLYIKAFCEGLDEVPPIDESIRQSLREGYVTNGIAWLQEIAKNSDPLFYESGEIHNPHRVLRALEVKLSTGTSIMELHTSAVKDRPFRIISVGLELPREILYDQINRRVDDMMSAGLREEVTKLRAFRDSTALQTVGYRELFEHIDGKISVEEAVTRIKTNTRRYAKRQLTWFKRDPHIRWFAPHESQQIIDYIRQTTAF